MKPAVLIAVCFAAFTCACGGDSSAQPTIQLAKGTSSLHALITSIRDSKGEVRCGLFNAPDGFPGPSPIIGGSLKANANGGSIECDYDDLPAGTYAITTMHDENDNGKLDTNVLGIPTEGHGASNDAMGNNGPPPFDKAKVDVADGATLNLTIHMTY
jgi:uncharacterized protein (DUF2141 family)